VMVASLYQAPVAPFQQSVTHRPLDYWGCNLVDNLISKLPDALTPDGVAYLMQLSILSQRQTAELLAERGFAGRVVDFGFMGVAAPFDQQWEQILRVEATSDAYHLTFADGGDVMVPTSASLSRGDPRVRSGRGPDKRFEVAPGELRLPRSLLSFALGVGSRKQGVEKTRLATTPEIMSKSKTCKRACARRRIAFALPASP
jgi:hypothetical protein